MQNELHWQDATEIARRIKEKEISAVDVLEHFLLRVDKINPTLNCIVELDKEGARARAKAADEALAKGELWGPLHGVPMTIKNSFEVVGMKNTVGSEMLKDYRPATNSTVAQHLIDAGAICFGKTNTPEFCMDLQSSNPLYGATDNAWKAGRIAGGSSGGTAVALAAGLTAVEFGSDMGGSSRNPAHYNNIFGMRPTWGTISGRGHIPGAPGSLNIDEFGTPGPLARSARDLRLFFDIARGSDPIYGHICKPDLPECKVKDIKNLRVGLWLDDKIAPVSKAVSKVLKEALGKLKAAGLTSVENAKPDIDEQAAYNLYIRMSGAVTGAGIHPDERAKMQAHIDSLGEDYDKNDSNIQRQLGTLMSVADYQRDGHEQGVIRAKWAEYFQQYDIMLSPIMSNAAIEHGENFFTRDLDIDGKTYKGRDQLFWSANQVIAILSSTIFPAGFTEEGMPVGFQITAPHLGDYTAIEISEMLSSIIGAADKNPPIYPNE